jgi:toxin-antitoxin system PIN domain toxin
VQMPDVNILVYAHREGASAHNRYATWLTRLAEGPEPFALSELVLHGFLRVATNQKIFQPASTTTQIFRFIDALLERPGCCLIRPGGDHWEIFRQLCSSGDLKGNLIADAAHAAVAIESGCEWVTSDTDFARFAPLLRWKHL